MNEETLGKRIARLRMERGWTQTDLGKKIEKAQSTIAGWETDARDKRPDIIELAHIFGVDAYYLKTGIETLICGDKTVNDVATLMRRTNNTGKAIVLDKARDISEQYPNGNEKGAAA